MDNNAPYQKHLFICTNQRAEGLRVSCGEQHGLKLVAEFKKQINDLKLPIKIRAQKAGCFDICEHGPNVVIYPDGVFYGNVKTVEDVSEIVNTHLVNGQIVERLKIKFNTK
jgi:(2Fe-2S) ferredoxin